MHLFGKVVEFKRSKLVNRLEYIVALWVEVWHTAKCVVGLSQNFNFLN